jgi:hypothetical protein
MTDEIHELVGRYLRDEISVSELQVGLPDGWDMDQSGDETARRLVLRIMGNLAEFFNGSIDEDALRSRLSPLLPPLQPQWYTYGSYVDQGSTATGEVVTGALG